MVELLQFRVIWSPHSTTMEHSQANAGLAQLAVYPRWEVSGGYYRQEFPELSPGHVDLFNTLKSCGPTTCTVCIGWSCYQHHYRRQHRGTRFLEDIMANIRDQELDLLHVCMELFTFHAILPCLELGDAFLLGFRSEHREASTAHQCGTHAKAPPAPGWRAVG